MLLSGRAIGPTRQLQELGQEVVRRQLLDECDILVALIGKRLGTPTLEHESGTVDEIMGMYQRDGSDFGGHHVQVYFKRESVPIDEKALAEAARVINFKSQIEDKGFFYGTYESNDDISNAILPNIQRAIEWYMKKHREAAINVPPSRLLDVDGSDRLDGEADLHAESDEAEEPGILDLIVNFHAKIMRVASRFTIFSSEINELTAVAVASSPILEFEEPAEKRAAVNKLADRMSVAAGRISNAVGGGEDELEVAIQEMISAIRKELSSNEDRDVSDKAIAEMLEAMRSSVEHIDGLQASIASAPPLNMLPDLTAKLRRAKRLLSAAFDSFGAFLVSTRDIIVAGELEVERAIKETRH